MTKYYLFRWLMPVLLLVSLLVIGGCSGYNHLIRPNDIPVSKKYYYFIQGKKVMFLVDNVSADQKYFSGTVVMNGAPVAGHKIVIYPVSDKSLIIEGMSIKVPVNQISRVETARISPVNKIVAILGGGLVVLFIISSFSRTPGLL